MIDTLRGPQENETSVDLLVAEKVIVDVLCSEWDVLVEIQSAFEFLSDLELLRYVKGHQDCDKRYDQLDLMGQPNI